jgi:hypothetical protein
MDTHPHSDDMNDLERRLSGWAPASAGLDADAMLYAAGRAAGRPGPARFVWPALTGMLSLLVVALGSWLAVERSERLLLAQQLRQQTPASSPSLSAPVVPIEATDDAANPDSYLAARRAYREGLDAWPGEQTSRTDMPDLPVKVPIYQVGHRDGLLDP